MTDLTFRRHVRRLHQLGDRVVGEFLAELGAERSIRTVIDRKLARYAELTPEQVEAIAQDIIPKLRASA